MFLELTNRRPQKPQNYEQEEGILLKIAFQSFPIKDII